MSNEITIYILELEHGCFYVGQSAAPDVRVDAHRRGKAAAWTRVHRCIRLLEQRPAQTRDPKVAEALENELTRMLMRTHGWQRVRGGFFCSISEEATRKNLLHHGCHAELAVCRPLERPQEEEPRQVQSPAVGRAAEPSRNNAAWKKHEEETLCDLYKSGVDATAIAQILGRTPGAVASRAVRLKLAVHRRDVRLGNQ